MPGLSFNAKAVWFLELSHLALREMHSWIGTLSLSLYSNEKYTKHYYQQQNFLVSRPLEMDVIFYIHKDHNKIQKE